MPAIATFPLPLLNSPAPGFVLNYEEHTDRSDFEDLEEYTPAEKCEQAVCERDKFLEYTRCIICGEFGQRFIVASHMIKPSETAMWSDLKQSGWIPQSAQEYPEHAPRNALSMCPNHQRLYDAHEIFIRFVPSTSKYVFINYSPYSDHGNHHGKAVTLDVKDRHAPFPALLLTHEMRIRGFCPFAPTIHELPDEIPWQDWIVSEGLLREKDDPEPHLGLSKTRLIRYAGDTGTQGLVQDTPPAASGDVHTALGLDGDVVADLLAASRNSASWKACEVEGTNWEGTADENVQRYISTIGVDGGTD